MKTYKVTITGETPLLMHNDDIAWCEQLKSWQTDPANKKKGAKGDDRTPSWTWLGYLYEDMGKVAIPSDNLMTAMREGGAKISTGKKNETFRKVMASMVVVNETGWALDAGAGAIDYAALRKDALAIADMDFESQLLLAEEYGFRLFAKRARVASSKHIRVRPRFDRWSCAGSITVLDDERIPRKAFQMVLEAAGREAGLCDWRPSSPSSPGAFGKFAVKVE